MSDPCGATRSRLDELLAKRATPGIDPAKIDERVWNVFGDTRTVVVVALAGQARRIAAFDIIHELQLQRQLRTLFSEALIQYDGVGQVSSMGPHVALFRDASDALNASLETLAQCEEHNSKRPAESALPACVGIGHGGLIRSDGDVYGRERTAATLLATDASEAGQVLVTQAFRNTLGDENAKDHRIVDLGRAVPGSTDNFRVSPIRHSSLPPRPGNNS